MVRLTSMLECEVSNWPLTYVGLSQEGNPTANAF